MNAAQANADISYLSRMLDLVSLQIEEGLEGSDSSHASELGQRVMRLAVAFYASDARENPKIEDQLEQSLTAVALLVTVRAQPGEQPSPSSSNPLVDAWRREKAEKAAREREERRQAVETRRRQYAKKRMMSPDQADYEQKETHGSFKKEKEIEADDREIAEKQAIREVAAQALAKKRAKSRQVLEKIKRVAAEAKKTMASEFKS